jgi:EAL domain-containing protein (putative c-di-GMP-specific phosphodiesterase class I)
MTRSLLDRMTAEGAIRGVFQPIVDLRRPRPALAAIEGLARGRAGSNLESPDLLFEYARRKHEEVRFDRAAIASILAAAADIPGQPALHVNIHVATVERDAELIDFLAAQSAIHGIALPRLTLEIIEHSELVDEEPYVEALFALRRAGISIALDDVGAGTSNFRMILLTRPSLLKADRCIVQGIANDPFRQATLRAIRMFADQVGAGVVAEGIENGEDLAMVRSLGAELGQGFLFSAPVTAGELSRLSYLDVESERAWRVEELHAAVG